MGDIHSLVEKAEEAMNDDDADALMKRIMEQKYDFNDWLKQTKTMTKMGGMSSMSGGSGGVSATPRASASCSALRMVFASRASEECGGRANPGAPRRKKPSFRSQFDR